MLLLQSPSGSHFNPRFHEEATTASASRLCALPDFNPRFHEEATALRFRRPFWLPYFNPRFHEEATFDLADKLAQFVHFNPRFHEEATALYIVAQGAEDISIHASMRKRPTAEDAMERNGQFQSTLP